MNSRSDTSLFILQCQSSVVFLLVYVDDVIITGSNVTLIEQVVTCLDKVFALKDLECLSYFLEFQVHYLESGFLVNQAKYVDDLLFKLNMSDIKATVSPGVQGRNLLKSGGQPLADPFLYISTVGALQYLTHTCPDIAYMVNHLSQFLQHPTDVH